MAEEGAPAKGGYKQVCKYSPKCSSFLGYIEPPEIEDLDSKCSFFLGNT
jgi:hypothetical protein